MYSQAYDIKAASYSPVDVTTKSSAKDSAALPRIDIQQNSSVPSLVFSSPSSSDSDVVFLEKKMMAATSAGRNTQPLPSVFNSSAQTIKTAQSTIKLFAQPSTAISPARRLAFLDALEAVPSESDILTLKKYANSMSSSTTNVDILHTSFRSFFSCLKNICERANYWSWAPNYMTFLILFVRGEFGVVADNSAVKYAIQVFCLFSCHVCKYDQEREPSIYNYFANFFIPQLMAHIGDFNADGVSPSVMALSYVFYKIPVDRRVIKMIRGLRVDDIKGFYRSSNTLIRQHRAMWMSCIAYQLIFCIKKGEDVETSKSNLLRCYDEAVLSHKYEKVTKISKIYETYFDLKSQE